MAALIAKLSNFRISQETSTMDIPFYQFASSLPGWSIPLIALACINALGYSGVGIRVWILVGAALGFAFGIPVSLWYVLAALAILFATPVRRGISAMS